MNSKRILIEHPYRLQRSIVIANIRFLEFVVSVIVTKLRLRKKADECVT